MQGAVYSSRSALYAGLFENGVRRAEKGAECELYDKGLEFNLRLWSATLGGLTQ